MIMKKSLFCLLTLFCVSGLLANSKGNIAERKKNFDSRAKFLVSMQEIIISEKLLKQFQELKDTVSEVDIVYRSGEKDRIKKTLTIGETKLAAFQKEYAMFISLETKELMEAYSSQVTAAEEKESSSKSKPTITHTAVKEKSSEYYTIAKADYANAAKFERDGNLQYSIQLYKRALSYTVLAFEKSNYQLPEKFANLSKKVTPEEDSEVSPIGGTHTNPSKDSKETKPTNPNTSKSKK